MKNKIKFFAAVIISSLVIVGCSDDPSSPPVDQNPQELITTVILKLVDLNDTTKTVEAAFRDTDGPGGNAPVIDTLKLSSGTNYRGSIEVLDESKNPAEDITEEIKDEQNDHQFFYTPQGGVASRITINKTDLDTNNPPLPVGLEFTVQVSAGVQASGNVRVVLSHYDEGPKTANPSNESDIDIEIPVEIN